jgi:carboxylesterase
MPVLPGAEPFDHQGGPIGVLLCHGFTGSPASMRPWGERLAAEGFTVLAPRWPGHGTSWKEMSITRWDDWLAAADRSLQDIRKRCETVAVGGLSMGAALALRLAEIRPKDVDALVLVNPSVHTERKDVRYAVPVLKYVIPALGGIKNDIKKPGQDEVAYDRVPLKSLASLTVGWKQIKADIDRITAPALIFNSDVDHVVELSNTDWLAERLPTVEVRRLPNSYHVATLDNDADLIFDGSIEFVRSVAKGSTNAPASS